MEVFWHVSLCLLPRELPHLQVYLVVHNEPQIHIWVLHQLTIFDYYLVALPSDTFILNKTLMKNDMNPYLCPRSNLIRALDTSPTSDLGAQWWYSCATAITTLEKKAFWMYPDQRCIIIVENYYQNLLLRLHVELTDAFLLLSKGLVVRSNNLWSASIVYGFLVFSLSFACSLSSSLSELSSEP